MTNIYLGNQPVYDPSVIPNNSRINGVEHFYQTTKPTIRGDGSALGIGDRWWKTDNGSEWFWNGTYWLSSQEYTILAHMGTNPYQGLTINTGSFSTRGYIDTNYTDVILDAHGKRYFTTWVIECRVLGTIHSADNYFIVEPSVLHSGTHELLPISFNTSVIGGGGSVYSIPVNYAIRLVYPQGGSMSGIRHWLQGFGTNPSFRLSSCLNYRVYL